MQRTQRRGLKVPEATTGMAVDDAVDSCRVTTHVHTTTTNPPTAAFSVCLLALLSSRHWDTTMRTNSPGHLTNTQRGALFDDDPRSRNCVAERVERDNKTHLMCLLVVKAVVQRDDG